MSSLRDTSKIDMHGADDRVSIAPSILVVPPDSPKQPPVSSDTTQNHHLCYSLHDRSASPSPSQHSSRHRERSASPSPSDHSPHRCTPLRHRTPPRRRQERLPRVTLVEAEKVSQYWRTYNRCEDIESKIRRTYDGPADLRSRIRIAQYQQNREDWNAVVVPPRPARNMELDELDEPDIESMLLGPLGLTLDAHAAQMDDERAERLAQVQALMDGQNTLTIMPVLEESQNTVFVESVSEMPLPQPASQHQEDVAMADNTENAKAINHFAQKNEAAEVNFNDSGFFDGDDAHEADDEEFYLSSDTEVDADNDAFTPADQIDTTNVDLQETPTEPVQLLKEYNRKSNKTDDDLQNTPAEPVQVPSVYTPYEEWSELATTDDEQDTSAEPDPVSEKSKGKSKQAEPEDGSIDRLIEAIAQGKKLAQTYGKVQDSTTVIGLGDESVYFDRCNFALLDRHVPPTESHANTKGKGKKDIAEPRDAEYVNARDDSSDDMPETFDGTFGTFKPDISINLGGPASAKETTSAGFAKLDCNDDLEWDIEVQTALLEGAYAAKLGSKQSASDDAFGRPTRHKTTHWVETAQNDALADADKSSSKKAAGKKRPDAKKTIYWFEEDDSDIDSDSDSNSDSDINMGIESDTDMDDDSERDTGEPNSHSDALRRDQSSSTQPDKATEDATASTILMSVSTSSALVSPQPEITLRERVDAMANSLWKRYKSCELAEMPIETISIESQLSHYTEQELQGYVKSFLNDNSGCFRPYMAIIWTVKTDENKKIKYSALSEAWHNMEKRVELCGALKWILALLQKSAPAIREIDKVLQTKLVALQPLRICKEEEPEGIEKELAALREPLNKFEEPKTTALLENDAAWQKHHDELESIKNSNEKRNDLLRRAGISEKVVKMFRKLVTSAELHTCDAKDLFEDTSNEFLRDTLWRILDIVRFNDCNWRFQGLGLLCTYPVTKENIRCIDGLVPVTFEEDIVRTPYSGVAQDEAIHGMPFPQAWKTEFPPNIMPNFSEPAGIFFDVVEITTGSNERLSAKRVATLKALHAQTFYEWISIYASRIGYFRRSMEAIQEELNRLNSDSPHSLVHRANGSLKYVAVHNPVEARENLEEKQLWFRDYSLLVFKKIQKIIKIWTGEPNNVETEEIVALLQQIKDRRVSLLAILPEFTVTYPWVAVDKKQFFMKINAPGGCKREQGLCPNSHEHAGEICASVKMGVKCSFGNKCFKLHPVGTVQGRRPSDIAIFPLSSASDGISPEHTPEHTPGRIPGTAGKFCPKVNKPGGCQEDYCSFSHTNEGRVCKKGKDCTFGDTCAFVHPEKTDTTPQRSAPGTPLTDKNTDLKPLLDQVLADPRHFNVCLWVNKPPVYCVNGDGCSFNHTLEVVECPDNNSGNCTRDRCFLMHKPGSIFNQRQRSVTPQGSKRSREDGGLSQMQPKRTRLEIPLRTASPNTPVFIKKHFTTNAELDDQQSPMQMPVWPTQGQLGQQQQGRESPFSAPTAPRTVRNQQIEASQSAVQAWPAQYPQSPQQFMNSTWTAAPLPQLYMATQGPAQAQQFNQHPKPQPLSNAPKTPRGQCQQQLNQVQSARGPVRQQNYQDLRTHMPLLRKQIPENSHARTPVLQQQLYQSPRSREPMRRQPLYQALQTRAPVQHTQRQVPTAPTPMNGFSIRDAADPHQQPPPTRDPRVSTTLQT
jgi:hypothetical protein